MLKSIRTLIVVAVGCSAVYLASPSRVFAAGSPTGHGTKEETYIVVLEGEEYKAITSSTYNDEVKRVKDENQKAMDEWHDAVKTDKTTPRPKKIMLKKMPVTFKTQKGAPDYIDKQLEKEGKLDKPAVVPK